MTLPSERNFHDPQTQALPDLSGYHRVRHSLGDAPSATVKGSDDLRVHQYVDAMWFTVDREMLSYPDGECLVRSHGLVNRSATEAKNPTSEPWLRGSTRGCCISWCREPRQPLPAEEHERVRVSDFQIEFDAMKPSVHLRSGGLCEAAYFSQRFCERLQLRPEAAKEAYFALRAARCRDTSQPRPPPQYRSRGGSNALSNLLETCLNCHQWIHSFPELSNRLGLSLHEWESEEI